MDNEKKVANQIINDIERALEIAARQTDDDELAERLFSIIKREKIEAEGGVFVQPLITVQVQGTLGKLLAVK